jgi:hypothetical protein
VVIVTLNGDTHRWYKPQVGYRDCSHLPLPCPCYAGLDPGLDPERRDPEFADG